MGAVIAALADSAVITADRPASEDPTRAARSMLAAARARGLDAVFVRDRAEAIALAASRLGPGDALVVTGKGIEPWGDDDSASGFRSDLEALGAVLDLPGGAEPALAEA
jgi:UDP-N-acetylmuramyl tripeptide synthase